jgi:hypothetical protein
MTAKKSTSRDYTLIGLILTALLGFGGWGFQYVQTKDAQNKTYQLEQLQDFSKSASDLDKVVVKLFTMAAEQKSLEEEKSNFASIYTDHIVKTEANRFIFGEINSEKYISDLKHLSDLIDSMEGPRNNAPRVEAYAQVIRTRRIMLQKVLQT